MDRRGQEESGSPIGVVIILIVFMLVVLIAIPIVQRTLDNDGFSEKQCQASLLLTRVQTMSPICIAKQPAIVPLECDRKFIGVTDRSVTVDGEERTEYYDAACTGETRSKGPAFRGELPPAQMAPVALSKTGDTCLAHNVLAEEMRKCWQTFGSGENVVFQQGEINEYAFWEGKDTARTCFVCAEVTVEAPVDEFAAYLKTKRIKGGPTYHAYLAQNPKAWCDPKLRDPTCWEGIAKERTDMRRYAGAVDWFVHHVNRGDKETVAIPQETLPAQTYAVTFIRRGMSTCATEEAEETARGYLTFSVQAIPVDQLRSQCEVVLA